MNRTSPHIATGDLRVGDDGTPSSQRFGDVYYSADGGLGETRHTFLGGNGLPERWRGVERFTIVETGFGTGLNFLATWQRMAALRARRRPPALCVGRETSAHAATISQPPVRAWPELAPLAHELLRVYPPPVPGFHRLHLAGGRVALTLLFGDATAMLAQLDAAADAFFLDGFAPAKNPEMWTRAVLRELARLAAPGCHACDLHRGG